ncbi:competence/damage-inducible protein A [Candidatus Halobonum tyrrellensis]|uniref:Molybdenum cofactor synthesis domain protein n=1 Tax=Candidatus Halobonum tyrrellensis G22 TaxID=1324957 RepID=V4HBH1_9EURY|nr:molybdopterin-binding protein [Candidatus Halobonum tyrrellensis]ESP88060.1 molybdenum cofactor synthesis domain protein [Candidatus Halobonum tyrrellensis G22]
MDAAIVTVGDELLSGETVDTNASWLAARLAERGVDVERVTTVPDRVDDIAAAVAEYRGAYDAVLVTGGVGPTHDDVTMDGVAAAFGVELAADEEALAWLADHGGYAGDDLDEGTTHLPAGARPLHNEAGVAPGCVIESVYVFPGVPAEMEAMFEGVAGEFSGERRYAEHVETSEPESTLLDRFETLRAEFDVTVGSYPGDGVRVKLAGTDPAEVERAAAWLRERVDPVGE